MNEVFKKIIEKLEKKISENKDRIEDRGIQTIGDRNVGIRQAIEIVKHVEEEHNNGWIPCTDRLPTSEEYQQGNGRFLVTDGNRTYEAEFDIYESHTFGRSQMSANWFVTDKCVTHWQNEPLPPKSYQPKGK